MEQQGQAGQNDLSDASSNSIMDLSNYKYPELAQVSEKFRCTIANSISKRDECSFPLMLGDHPSIQVEDLFNRPNLLIAGTTGSGKTQFLYNQIAFWLFYKHPAQLKFIFCGSKTIDYNLFGKLERHFLAAIDKGSGIVSVENFRETAAGVIFEIDERIRLFTLAGVKTIKQYNALIIKKQLNYNQGHHFLPDIAMIIDDLYNFSCTEELDSLLILLTQKNSHTGVYVMAATSQVNSPNISRQLRSNFVLRLAFRLISQSDSKKILDSIGAEKLTEPGELIYNFSGQLIKAKQPYVEYEELQGLVEDIAAQKGYPDSYRLFNPNPEPEIDLDVLDPLIEDAARLIVMHQQGSTSLIQRKLKLGYNRAGRMIDQLEVLGIIGPFEGSKAREVLIPDNYALEQFFMDLFKPDFEKKTEKEQANITETFVDHSIVTSLDQHLVKQQVLQTSVVVQSSMPMKQGFWQKFKNLF
ncbi:DNA translocase FtsK [Pedobacter nyackensis]|uniref:DNA translocase FtsK n=1 Tax=Pedobacter nyackensis TaxID=475255 RepID=UPI002930260A|nr:DNA translocase FtsK [Pedobacter nyackensis]